MFLASTSWRWSPQLGQGKRTLWNHSNARAKRRNSVTPKIMMTTAISRPIEPSRTMSPNPVVVSAETGPLLFEVLQQSRFGEFLRLEQVLQGVQRVAVDFLIACSDSRNSLTTWGAGLDFFGRHNPRPRKSR
jgi:hypothetical protein